MDSVDELAVGTRVADRYEVTGPPLGRGASGVVYPGVADDGARVALKLLHPTVVADVEAFGRLQREVGRATTLAHPHVLAVRGLVAHERRSILVTEHVDGPALSSLESLLPMTAVASLGLQLCGALASAHGAGLVHGDVRPGNVLVGRSGARLFDFGLAGMAPLTVRPGETPPEVLDGSPPSARSDLYGVGLVLARAALGHDVFRGGTPWARLGAQRDGRPCIESLPLGLQALLRSLLHPDPSRRPADALEVRRALVALSKRPERSLALRTRSRPSVGIRRTWAVHGIDPQTGGACLFASRLSKSQAMALQRRLDGEGWTAAAEPVALGWRDAVWVIATAALGAVILPVLGALLAGVWVLRWRTRRLRGELSTILPACSVDLPPHRPKGREALVIAGILLVLAGPLSLLSGWLAFVPAIVACLILIRASQQLVDPALEARRARILGGFQAMRRQLEVGPSLVLDRHLAQIGTLDAVEAAWRDGETDDATVIDWLERGSEDLSDPPGARR